MRENVTLTPASPEFLAPKIKNLSFVMEFFYG
jgi:hypothetical protein